MTYHIQHSLYWSVYKVQTCVVPLDMIQPSALPQVISYPWTQVCIQIFVYKPLNYTIIIIQYTCIALRFQRFLKSSPFYRMAGFLQRAQVICAFYSCFIYRKHMRFALFVDASSVSGVLTIAYTYLLTTLLTLNSLCMVLIVQVICALCSCR